MGFEFITFSTTKCAMKPELFRAEGVASCKVIGILEFRKYLLIEIRIQEIFARGIRNRGNICWWNLESRKHFSHGIRNPGNISVMESGKSRKHLHVESGIHTFKVIQIPQSKNYLFVESGRTHLKKKNNFENKPPV